MVLNKRDRWDSSPESEDNHSIVVHSNETASNISSSNRINKQQKTREVCLLNSSRGTLKCEVKDERASSVSADAAKELIEEVQMVENDIPPQDDIVGPTTRLEEKEEEVENIDGKRKQFPSFRLHNPLLEGCRSVYDTYERIGHVSEGTYGVVWKARDVATNEIVALKQIKFDYDNEDGGRIGRLMSTANNSRHHHNGGGGGNWQKEGFPLPALREISVLLQLSHECIVTVKEMVVGNDFNKVFMVMEYMEFDLKEGLTKFSGALPQSELKGILHQILLGTDHMHSQWLLHRDLKTSNILVHKSGRVAICDFGLARRYELPLRELTQLVVTLWYRCPELLFGEKKYGPAVDMWSIGCIFGELICKEAIFQGKGELDQLDKIFECVGVPTNENWPTFSELPNSALFRWRPARHRSSSSPSNKNPLLLQQRFPINSPQSSNQAFLDANGYDLLSKLLALDPNARITAKEALQHPYFHTGVLPQTPKFFVEQ